MLVAGSAWGAIITAPALGALIGGTAGHALTAPERAAPPPGVRLATSGQTRRAVLRQNAAVLAGAVTAFALLGSTLEVWWPPALFGLTLGLAELTIVAHVTRWERRHPDARLTQRLGRPRGWSFPWPSRDPDAYR